MAGVELIEDFHGRLAGHQAKKASHCREMHYFSSITSSSIRPSASFKVIPKYRAIVGATSTDWMVPSFTPGRMPFRPAPGPR